jgi:large subunit ribosomal protein L32
MAVPKRKHSKARAAKRKANWKLELPTLVKCSQCHSFKLPHRVCKECGYYNGKVVIKEKVKAK